MKEICHIRLGCRPTTISHIEGQSFRDYDNRQESDAFGLGAAILVPKSALLRHAIDKGIIPPNFKDFWW